MNFYRNLSSVNFSNVFADSITTNNIQPSEIITICGDLEVQGKITTQCIQESDGFKELKEEVKNLKTLVEEYKEHVKILEKKLDELYYAPDDSPIFNAAQTSFEKNLQERQNLI